MKPTKYSNLRRSIGAAFVAFRSVFHLYSSSFTASSVRSADDRLQAAVKALAELEAQILVHDRMRLFYDQRVAAIDHTTDWWGYADACEKRKNAVEDAAYQQKKIAAAQLYVDDCVTKLARAREKAARVEASANAPLLAAVALLAKG